MSDAPDDDMFADMVGAAERASRERSVRDRLARLEADITPAPAPAPIQSDRKPRLRQGALHRRIAIILLVILAIPVVRAVISSDDTPQGPPAIEASEPRELRGVLKPVKSRPAASDTLPIRLVTVPPRYPVGATEEGIVSVDFIVGADGRTRDIIVVDAPTPALGDAATDAVRQWRYLPARVDGQPTARRVKTVRLYLGPEMPDIRRE